jgi:hypothetical protein
MPTALVEKMMRADLKKEAVLERVCHVKITPEMVAAEVQRIDTTTRAPEMLAEIKAALGSDPRVSPPRWRAPSSSSAPCARVLKMTPPSTPRSVAQPSRRGPICARGKPSPECTR